MHTLCTLSVLREETLKWRYMYTNEADFWPNMV